MVKNKYSLNLVLLLTLFITGCSGSKSSRGSEQPVAVLDMPITVADQSQMYPSWFVNPPEFVHGVGIASYNSRKEQESFDEAFLLAIEDLNSNAFACVTIEDFISEREYYKEEEVAITEKYNFKNVVKIDSSISGGFVFMMVSVEKQPLKTKNIIIANTTFRFTSDNSVTLKTADKLVAKGAGSPARINVYQAWALSKRASLRVLAGLTNMNVRSLDKKTTDDYNKITYVRSRISLRNIRVVKRWIENDEFCTVLEVSNSNFSNVCSE